MVELACRWHLGAVVGEMTERLTVEADSNIPTVKVICPFSPQQKHRQLLSLWCCRLGDGEGALYRRRVRSWTTPRPSSAFISGDRLRGTTTEAHLRARAGVKLDSDSRCRAGEPSLPLDLSFPLSLSHFLMLGDNWFVMQIT